MDYSEQIMFGDVLAEVDIVEDVLNKIQPIPGSPTETLNDLEECRMDWDFLRCKMCKLCVHTLYCCAICDDYDLCVTCYDQDGHPHKMEKLSLDLDEGSSPVDPQDARNQSIKRCIDSVVHACQCCNANCQKRSCQKMKRVVAHSKICKREANEYCPICKQIISLCCYHAKNCKETKCPMPFCQNLKYKIKQHKMQAQLQKVRLQKAQLLRKRMAFTNTGELGEMVSRAVSPGAQQAVVMQALL